MTPNVLLAPYPEFSDESGKPLENGQLYIGAPDMEPQENPVIAYWDEALTIPVAQPVRTGGGYPMHNGTPGRIYTDGVCSLLVLNRRSEFVYYAPRVIDMNSVDGFIEANNMRVKDYAELRDYSGQATIVDVTSPGIAGRFYVYDSALENGGTQIVGIKKWKRLYSGTVMANWFGANGAAVQSALNAAVSDGVYEVTVPAGDYPASAEIVVPPLVNIKGVGTKSRIVATFAPSRGLLVLTSATGALGNIAGRYVRDLCLIGNGGGIGLGTDVLSSDSPLKYLYGFSFHNVLAESFNTGFQMQALWHSQMNQCTTSACSTGLHLYGQCVSVNVSASHFRKDSFSGSDTFGIRIQPRAYAWNSNNLARSEAIVINGETMCIGQRFGIYVDDVLDLQMTNLDLDYIKDIGIHITNVNGGCNITNSWIATDAASTAQFKGVNLPAATSIQQVIQLRGLHINATNANTSGNNIGIDITNTGGAYQRSVNIGDCTFAGGLWGIGITSHSGMVNIDGCALGNNFLRLNDASNVSVSNTYLNAVQEVNKPAGKFNRYYNNTGPVFTGGIVQIPMAAAATTGSFAIPGYSSLLTTYIAKRWDIDTGSSQDRISISGAVVTVNRATPVGVPLPSTVEIQAY